MKEILKYNFAISDEFKLELPQGYEILKVDMQNNIPTMWVLNNKNHSGVYLNVKFFIYGTGQPISNSYLLEYIDTIYQGGFVWHLFMHKLRDEVE